MARAVTLLAGTLVVTGAVLLAMQSGAFTSVTADRSVSGQVAPPPEGYLSLQDGYGGGNVTNYFCFGFFGCFQFDVPQPAVDVENRYVEDYGTVQARVVAVQGGNDSALEVRNVPGQLAVGATATVDLGCTGSVTDNGTADVVVAFDAAGANVHVDGARVTVRDVGYDCLAF